MQSKNASYRLSLSALAFVLLLPVLSQAGAYVCQTPTGTTIQDRPCATTEPPQIARRSTATPQFPLSTPPEIVLPDASTPGSAPAQALCAEKWPTDFRMQRHCREQQQQAASTIQQRLRRLNFVSPTGTPQARLFTSPLGIALMRCITTWETETGHYDWRMANHCQEQQLTAYRRVN